MKKLSMMTVAAALAVIFGSCVQPGEKGPLGPAGTDTVPCLMLQQGSMPTVSYAGVQNAMIWSADTDGNYGSGATMQLGVASDGSVERGCFRFSIYGMLPTGSKVTKAELKLYVTNVIGSSPDVSLHEMNVSWIEALVTWADRYTDTEWWIAGGDFHTEKLNTSEQAVSAGGKWYTWQLNPARIQIWAEDDGLSLGFIIKNTDESLTGQEYLIAASDYPEAEYRPQMRIYYSLP